MNGWFPDRGYEFLELNFTGLFTFLLLSVIDSSGLGEHTAFVFLSQIINPVEPVCAGISLFFDGTHSIVLPSRRLC